MLFLLGQTGGINLLVELEFGERIEGNITPATLDIIANAFGISSVETISDKLDELSWIPGHSS